MDWTAQEFADYFRRGFPPALYASPLSDCSDLSKICDKDIERAFDEAKSVFNPSLWEEESLKIAFFYLTAHFLIIDYNNSLDGMGSSGARIETSTSVGSVSVGYAIPTKVQENPALSHFMTTGYGSKYLAMLAPRMVGQIFLSHGGTTF